jgi:DNA-binding transcriptional LysR family regulator
MLVENTQRLLERLDNGEIDFAIIEGYFIKSEYDFLIFREKYIPVCGPNYVFAARGRR